MEASRERAEPDHPAPAAVQVLERSVDGVGDDLAEGDHDDVDDDHAAAQARRGELLDVQRRDASGDADANADEEAATDLFRAVR